jgi:hypothetical protein
VHELAYTFDNTRVEIPESRLPAPVLSWEKGKQWRLKEAYTYRDGDTSITVPEGFVFDLSSVPRVFWGLIAPFELSAAAPLLHDFLYRSGGKPAGATAPPREYSRKDVDRIFREIMRAEGVSAWRAALAYAAVRVFGRSAWRS